MGTSCSGNVNFSDERLTVDPALCEDRDKSKGGCAMRFGLLPESFKFARRRRAVTSMLALTAMALAVTAGTASAEAPVNSAPPHIKGSPQKGAKLTGEPGEWTTGTKVYAYEWFRCNTAGIECSVIPAANKPTYELEEKDVGATLVVHVTAGKAPATATALSRRTAVIEKSEDKARGMVLLALAAILVLGACCYKLLLGTDKRWSTSKVTAASWTYLLGAAILGFVVAKFVGDPRGLNNLMHSGLAGQYGLLIGGSLGAAVAAKGIVGNQTKENASAKTKAPKAKPLDIINNDAGEADLGDVQYVLFNLIAMVYFVGTVIQTPSAGMPHIPDVLLGLTSVAAVGYVAKKALPPATATAKVVEAKQKAGADITIKGKNLLTGEPATETPLIVLFGEKPQSPNKKEREGAADDTLTVTVPDDVAPAAKVEVLVITPGPTIVAAGAIEVEAAAPDPPPAQEGEAAAPDPPAQGS
jgi:hypothetical protein